MTNRLESIPAALLRAAGDPDSTRGYTFLADGGDVESFVSFADLGRTVARYASAFRRAGLRPGERVGLILPENAHFIFSFFGCMHAGLIPVPIAPPMNIGKLGSFLEHVRHIVKKSECAMLLTSPRIKGVLGGLLGSSVRSLLTVDELEIGSDELPLASMSGSDTAFLQFTSGSTAQPRGVALTHDNLSENAHCITRLGIRLTRDDVGCSWLPLFHDMGLIGFVISPLVTATPIVLMSPLSFVKRPGSWLRMMSEHRGTISFGPNFAYGLCVKRVKESELEGIDLSRWRVAGCGAEPIQPRTLESFAERFSVAGFRSRAYLPSYGMAESTLAVTFSPLDRGMRTDTVDLARLATEGVADAPCEGTEGAVRIVSCGVPFERHELKITDSEGTELPERQVGEVVIRGPSVMAAYYLDEDSTSAAMRDGWLRTGDLGYLAGGELYVCGRAKEVIIVSGRNYYPNDIEFALFDVEGLRKGNVVAFGLSDVVRGHEALVICAELRSAGADETPIRKEIEARVLEAFSLRPDEIVLLPPDSLPKTSSGKLQRTRTKEQYVAGSLGPASAFKEKMDVLKHWTVSQWNLFRRGARNS